MRYVCFGCSAFADPDVLLQIATEVIANRGQDTQNDDP
jgi:hypothetical protein